jgi:hypothetical protein
MIGIFSTLLLLSSTATAFQSMSRNSKTSITMMAEKSKALPFLARPDKVILRSLNVLFKLCAV